MDNFTILWLLLAGPLWAIITGYLLPRLLTVDHVAEDVFGETLSQKAQRSQPQQSTMLAGVIGGAALGPLALLYVWWRKRLPQYWLLITGLILVVILSQIVTLFPAPQIATVWLLFAGPLWAVIGWYVVSRQYRSRGLIVEGTATAGILGGFVAGPFILVPLLLQTPDIRHRSWWMSLVGLAAVTLYGLFALFNPTNLCVVMPYAPTYITQQALNGLTIGIIYALTAVGLTLIYSVQGIVNFAHGQFYMIGGYFSYYFLFLATNFLVQNGYVAEDFSLNPIWGIPIAGILSFVVGWIFERVFIRPMHKGKIEREIEYAILITFGFGFFLEYTTLAAVGPFPQRAEGFSSIRRLGLLGIELDGERFFGPFTLLADRMVTAGIGLALVLFLLWFLRRTWTGRALRAVSMDKQAAAVTGVNPLWMNTFAFALGSMLAGMSGAALIPIFAWVPWIGAESAVRAYVVVVLGGLGSVPGALIGGLIVGVVEALGSGCFPDPSRGAAYKEAFALAIFALVLLLKPTGLFGRKE